MPLTSDSGVNAVKSEVILLEQHWYVCMCACTNLYQNVSRLLAHLITDSSHVVETFLYLFVIGYTGSVITNLTQEIKKLTIE